MNKKTTSNIAQKRSLNLIDIESMVGSGNICEDQVARIRSRYQQVVRPGQLDQFYVTSSHHNMAATCFGWPQSERKFKSGKDGADILLAQRMLESDIKDKFSHVYLATNDGGLADFVTNLMNSGVKVTLVGTHGRMSYRLYNTGAQIVWLDSVYGLAA